MAAKTPYYITTAIAYANGAPHLGHAYEMILTDVMARFQRAEGRDVMFLTGMDEHGQKVAKTAADKGLTAKAFCDDISALFLQLTKDLNISQDDFIRTTEPRHHTSSQALWNKIVENGDIFLGEYAGWYSTREEAFFAEKELKIDAKTGEKKTPNDTEVEWMVEKSYFFKLSAYTERLLQYYEENPEFIQPASRRNEIISFVKGGLEDLSISRTSFDWGIPVPNDPDHVMYVWLDALTNYITGVGYPDTSSAMYQKYWPANVHVIGKDIIRFHCVFWPAFLMAADLPLPKQIFAHGFINVDGQKMSKSLGNVVAPHDLITRYGVDQTRYILMREVSHGEDGNFSHEQATNRLNADLANGLGNLAQRTLSMVVKNGEGKIVARSLLTDADSELLDAAYATLSAVREHAKSFRFNRAIEEIWKVVYKANAYIDEQAPWTLKKTDLERMNVVLSVIAETLRVLGILIRPLMPQSADRLLDQLKVEEGARDFAYATAEHALATDTLIDAPQGIFPRIEISEEAA
ncbi:MAG: methionine--tRNA ligase [Pseudobdellovibrionaceae bacterium]